jgi:hypothetical protein
MVLSRFRWIFCSVVLMHIISTTAVISLAAVSTNISISVMVESEAIRQRSSTGRATWQLRDAILRPSRHFSRPSVTLFRAG